MVINVPQKLRSSTAREIDRIAHTTGDVRRGLAAVTVPDEATADRSPIKIRV
jgi:hypothetical protein